MKRHLNTSYRLVWNHITGTLVVASELARSRGKRAGVAVALSLAAVTSVPALAADKVVQAGETVNDGTLTNHDNQIVFGTANGMTISTGLELGPDSEENTGGQWIQNGGIAGNTTVTTNGRQVVLEGGTASDTVIRDGGGQSLNGLAVNTTLNNRGEQWVHEGGVATGTIINRDGYQSVKSGGLATGTIINTGAEGGPDSDNSYTGQKVQGTAESTTINKNGRQIILFSGLARDTLIYAGGDQSVHGRALNTTLNGGYQYVHRDGLALNTVINEGGWQVVKAGGAAGNTTINQNGELRVHAGGEATAVTQNTGGALVTSTAATVIGTNRLGNFTVENGKADGVVLESGGRLDVLESHSAQNTLVDDGGTLAVSAGGKATSVTITSGGALIADSGATVEGTNASGKFSIDGTSGQASGLLLENGGSFTVNAGGQAGNTTVGHRGTLTLAAGGSLSGRTQLSKGASMVLNGDVVSTGDIVNAGEIRFDNQTTPNAALSRAVAKSNSPVTFHKLTTTNLTGQGGTINMRVRLDGSNASDQLVINGGQATGKTWLAFTNVGNSNLGVATTGQGIRVVDAQNGATTEEGAFALSRPLQAGAFNYTLNRDSDEDWYLRSENAYRAEVPLYTSMLTQAMDYDRILAGSRSHQTGVNGENNSVRLSIQGGHLGHDNNGGIARGATPESSGSYGFVRLEGDLLRTEVAGMSLTTGVYGAAGHSSVDVKDDDGSRAGTVRDDAGSLGGYLNLVHTSSGLWADIVAQGTRHSMKASSDNNDFRARGWGWLGSLETGLPFSITDNLMLEPQLQYTWQGLSLDDGQDNAGYVKFGHGSAQHVRAGFRLGSHNDMTFGEGTSSRDTLRDSAKHSVSELPVNWWVQPSVIRTFSSRGDMSMGTAAAGSNMTFSPSRNGTSLDLQAGLEARIRENITLGVQAGYAHSVSGSSAEGYNGQATLNMTF
ncbi:calcium-binding autotransporter Cah [Escherichia coli]|uniref:Adhesin n=296 Tax=Enterobacteriaceae TaxID=543 RepID=W0S434_ECOLX|nr:MULTISPECIES: calcium-binding autotransporter Cah [Escherichia]NP_309423.1 AidA-I family adhesin [Escherichia coli O157:H7 str. Sakai]EEC7213596.1 autotransporter adhesin Ag43 [Escherichia coli O103]EET3530403.1 autotransporter adhesin Ag43 [Escherichia coli O157:NM]EFT1061899.1 autotransporter adhesin Ag43 [Shigella sonnei]EFW3262618.1 autotransporter adhesin Ag43 [Shigella flexneri]EFZ42955.1 antigen 43 [Escherichia coli EPECa14]EHQ5527382.1 autotransporter adhesin Ag43 [Escherichia col